MPLRTACRPSAGGCFRCNKVAASASHLDGPGSEILEHMDLQPALFPRRWLGGARAMSMAAAWLMKEPQP